MRVPIFMLTVGLLACDSTDPGDDGSATGSTDGGSNGDGGATFEGGPAIVADGAVTWSLAFDEAAEAEGYVDCSYSRTFTGLQRLDRGYLCPDCDVIVRGTALVTDGMDCLAYISDAGEEGEETWAWSNEGAFFRGSGLDLPMSELTTFDASASDGADLAWEGEYEIGSGNVVLSAAGTLSWAQDPDQLLADPFPTQTQPYACGWPTNDPGDLSLDYAAAIGDTFPNVRLVDQCGEAVNLWDLHGAWLVMDTSQPDCGPCLSMAASAHDFVVEMAEEGIEVRVVSFLGNGLAEPFASPDADVYDSFVSSYDHGDPIFVDEGFGYAFFSRLAEEELGGGFGFPTWVVVDPTMTLVHGNVGFSSWDAVADVIRDGAR